MLEETRDRSTSKHRGFLRRTYSQHYGTPTDTVRELPLNFGITQEYLLSLLLFNVMLDIYSLEY